MQLKRAKNDVPTLLNISTMLSSSSLGSMFPTVSRSNNATAYNGNEIKTMDHMSVRAPPMVPLIITMSSENNSSRQTRNTRVMRNTLMSRNSAIPGPAPLPALPTRAMNPMTTSASARNTKEASNIFHQRSGPQRKTEMPEVSNFVTNSTRKIIAKRVSMTNQLEQSGHKSALAPIIAMLRRTTRPIIVSDTMPRKRESVLNRSQNDILPSSWKTVISSIALNMSDSLAILSAICFALDVPVDAADAFVLADPADCVLREATLDCVLPADFALAFVPAAVVKTDFLFNGA
mmetsp:Transcript_7454/g.18765  ORF Transcript_7454/g.18765 Transcript_7454/m.18765 type:complete len:290 (-) Transcript_7454:754-1623(-)